MAYEDYSAIEEFRVDFHGDKTLRLLKKAPSNQAKYQVITIFEKGFLITRDYPTRESKLQEILTLDFRYAPADTNPADIMANLSAVDLLKPDDTYRRYTVGSNTPPSFSDNIYSQTANAAFNNKNEIIAEPEPEP